MTGCSLWESRDALAAYAYGHARAPHPAAMQADRAEPFHHQSAFVRWRPRERSGSPRGPQPPPRNLVGVGLIPVMALALSCGPAA
ncbi:MAG: hypothetical protein H0U89_10635 [Acidimicrobiia bacterium]|nr:hypothetical protein [Acidimicrobiia bacterium]